MADGVWKVVYSQVFGHSKQLSLNKFFDPSTPSMRKVDNGEKKKKKKEENNDVDSGHKRRCQSTARTPIDWNAASSCQYLYNFWNQNFQGFDTNKIRQGLVSF